MAGSIDSRVGSTIVGTLMLATGVVLFIGGFQDRHDARALRARGVVVDSTVVDTAAQPQVLQVGGVFSTHHVQRVTFQFQDLQGGRRSATMKFLAKAYTVGETVRLIYDPGIPEHVDVFHSCEGWFSCDRPSIVSMSMGSMMCLVAAAMLIAELPPGTGTSLRRWKSARST